jgi:hypothetical protein
LFQVNEAADTHILKLNLDLYYINIEILCINTCCWVIVAGKGIWLKIKTDVGDTVGNSWSWVEPSGCGSTVSGGVKKVVCVARDAILGRHYFENQNAG